MWSSFLLKYLRNTCEIKTWPCAKLERGLFNIGCGLQVEDSFYLPIFEVYSAFQGWCPLTGWKEIGMWCLGPCCSFLRYRTPWGVCIGYLKGLPFVHCNLPSMIFQKKFPRVSSFVTKTHTKRNSPILLWRRVKKIQSHASHTQFFILF